MSAVETIRNDMRASAPVAEGTVVRFISHSTTLDHDYNYAAIFAAGFWWISGLDNFFGSKKFTHVQFMDVLNLSGVRDVQVAVRWESVAE